MVQQNSLAAVIFVKIFKPLSYETSYFNAGMQWFNM